MLFWLIYGGSLLLTSVFFGISAFAYSRHRRSTRRPAARRSPGERESQVAVLQAQFIVAPETALAEVRSLLRERLGAEPRLPSPIGAGNAQDLFLEYLSLL